MRYSTMTLNQLRFSFENSIPVCGVTVCLERTVPSEVSNIVACLRGFDHKLEAVGFEAGTLSQYLAHGLQSDGFEVVCLEARQVNAALSAMRNKTDRNDARGIAQILRTGWYARVHVKSRASHYIRALLSSRKAVLRKCIDLENEIRGLFKVFGIKLPASLGHGPFDARVRPLIETDVDLADALLPLLDARLVLYRTYLELDRRVKLIPTTSNIAFPWPTWRSTTAPREPSWRSRSWANAAGRR